MNFYYLTPMTQKATSCICWHLIQHGVDGVTDHPVPAYADRPSSWRLSISYRRQRYDLVKHLVQSVSLAITDTSRIGMLSSSAQQTPLSKMALSAWSCTSKSNTRISRPESSSSARCSILTSTVPASSVWTSSRTDGAQRTMWRRS